MKTVHKATYHSVCCNKQLHEVRFDPQVSDTAVRRAATAPLISAY